VAEDAGQSRSGVCHRRYTVGGATFDTVVYGYYEGKNLIYAARTLNGFTPKLRNELMKKFKPLEITDCLFSNLPEHARGVGARD
jgi:hypothetical protein